MPDYTNVLNRAASLDTAPAFDPFTGVQLWYDDENYFFAGDESGRVLEADCPWATQEMAESVLASVRGFVYQPLEAQTAQLDPAAELGDGVNVGGVYGPLASITTYFDAMCASDVAAPADEEIDHEYPYLTAQERAFRRTKAETYSLITKTSTEIRMEVANLRTNTDLSLEELEKSFGEDLDGLEKAFGADLDGLSKSFTETLKQYATLVLTNEKFETAVSTSKQYTDTETGKVVASLEKYSTITQTDSKFETAVSTSKQYTDGKITDLSNEFDTDLSNLENAVNVTLKNYSTITQTDSKISTSVTTSKEYTDTKTGEVIASLKNYSTINQTSDAIKLAVNGLINEQYANSLISQALDKIELSVSSKNGSTSLKLTSNGVEIDSDTVELSVNALNINGKINANQLNLTGAITFADLGPSVTDAMGDGLTEDEVRKIAAGYSVTLPNYIKSTYIGKTTIQSPKIEGNEISVYGSFQTWGYDGVSEVVTGYMGAASGEDKYGNTTLGVALSNSWSNGVPGEYYMIVTNSGCRIQGGENRIVVTNRSINITTAAGCGAYYNGNEIGAGGDVTITPVWG